MTIEVTDLDDAFLLFETLNDRGLELSAADLLKSHLLGKLSSLHRGDMKKITTASNTWDSMLQELGDSPGVAPYLRHYSAPSHQRVQTKNIFPYFKQDVQSNKPQFVLDELSTMAKLYVRIVNPPINDKAADDLQSTVHRGRHKPGAAPRCSQMAGRRYIPDVCSVPRDRFLPLDRHRKERTGPGDSVPARRSGNTYKSRSKPRRGIRPLADTNRPGVQK